MNTGRSAFSYERIIFSTKHILKMDFSRQAERRRADYNTSFDMQRAFLLALSFALFAAGADMPQRIVSLSPDLTEMLYGVGAFSRVVGVSNYETYPPEAAKLPSLGQLHNPDFEKLTALRPDLVVINNAQAPFLEDTLKELGLRVLKTSNRSIQEVLASMIAIGHATGNDSEAARLVTATREALDRVARKTARHGWQSPIWQPR